MQLINFDPETATPQEQIQYYKTLAAGQAKCIEWLEYERNEAINNCFQLAKELDIATEQIFQSPYVHKKEHST